MPRQRHFSSAHHLHCLIKNIHRRARVFDSNRFKLKFTRTLDDLRPEGGL